MAKNETMLLKTLQQNDILWNIGNFIVGVSGSTVSFVAAGGLSPMQEHMQWGIQMLSCMAGLMVTGLTVYNLLTTRKKKDDNAKK